MFIIQNGWIGWYVEQNLIANLQFWTPMLDRLGWSGDQLCQKRQVDRYIFIRTMGIWRCSSICHHSLRYLRSTMIRTWSKSNLLPSRTIWTCPQLRSRFQYRILHRNLQVLPEIQPLATYLIASNRNKIKQMKNKLSPRIPFLFVHPLSVRKF